MNTTSNLAGAGLDHKPLRRTDDQGRFKPDCTNDHICLQIRTSRRLLGLSRPAMAEQLGIDEDVFVACERGTRDVPAIVLAQVAKLINKPLPWFYNRSNVPAWLRDLRSTFERQWVTLLADGDAAVPAPATNERRRVLLVDDSPDVLLILGAFLEGAGLHVIKAANGDEALRIVGSSEVLHAIVTDNAMPGLSGADLLLQSAQLRPGLPGLIVTGGAADAHSLRELPKTVSILSKPLRREDLVAHIRHLTEPRQASPAQTGEPRSHSSLGATLSGTGGRVAI